MGWERGALALGVPWRACLLHGLLPTACACGARTHARAVFGVATARRTRERPSLSTVRVRFRFVPLPVASACRPTASLKAMSVRVPRLRLGGLGGLVGCACALAALAYEKRREPRV